MGRDQPTLSIETLSKKNQETSKKKSRKMKSTFTIFIAVLAIVSVSSKVLLPGDFSAKNDVLVVNGDVSTDAPTDAPPTNTPTNAPTTDAPTDTPTNTPTDTPTTDVTTDAPPTEAPTMAPTTTGAASISVTTFLVLLSAISMKL